jgi:large subunit ribosomal protein L31e
MAANEKLEREYIIPLRKEWLKASSFKRAKKSVRAAKEFLSRHMKVDFDSVKIGKFLNEKLWERGMKNPPHKIKVKVVRENNIAKAELADLTEAQKKMIEDETKSSEESRKKKEEEMKKRKEAEEKARKEAEAEAKASEEKIKKEIEKEGQQDLVTKEYAEEKLKSEKAQPKQLPQQQAQHTMKRQRSESK